MQINISLPKFEKLRSVWQFQKELKANINQVSITADPEDVRSYGLYNFWIGFTTGAVWPVLAFLIYVLLNIDKIKHLSV